MGAPSTSVARSRSRLAPQRHSSKEKKRIGMPTVSTASPTPRLTSVHSTVSQNAARMIPPNTYNVSRHSWAGRNCWRTAGMAERYGAAGPFPTWLAGQRAVGLALPPAAANGRHQAPHATATRATSPSSR